MSGKMQTLKDGKVGGMLVGRTHKECNSKGDCGIQMKNTSTGEPIEAQHGEVIVMAEAVSHPGLHEFDGKKMTNKEILSAINVNAGGVSFMEKGGEINGHVSCGCTGKKYRYNGEELTDHEIVKKMAGGGTIYGPPSKKIKRLAKQFAGMIKEQLNQEAPFLLQLANMETPDLTVIDGAREEVRRYVNVSGGIRVPYDDSAPVREYLYQFSPIGEHAHIDSTSSQAIRARKADLVVLPPGIEGTNCSNCQFVKIIDQNAGKGYCNNPEVRQMVTSRMCCIYWDAPGTTRVADQLGSQMNYGGVVDGFNDRDIVPQPFQVQNRFLPAQLEKGAILPDAFTETEKAVIEHFRSNPRTFVQLYGYDKSDISGLVNGNIVFTTGKMNSGTMDVFLTDSGRKLLFPLRADHGAVLQPAAPLVLKRGGDVAAGQFYKGPDAKYANPYEINRAIEEMLDSRPAPATDFSSEEKQFMGYYTGYGGLEKFGAEGAGLLYEYYTPVPVIEKMWGLAYKYGYKGGPVLEPACGIGDFFKFLPEQHTETTGYEINKYSARIASILYPHVTIENKYFEEVFIKNRNTIKDKIDVLPKYSLLIGNPPYGNFQGKFAGMGEKQFTKASNYIDYFIYRGLDLLETGGLLIYIIGAEVQAGGKPFLAQQPNSIKKKIAEKSVLLDAYRLPNGIFERTDVLTEIIVLQKQ